uniref:Uncharacterized protein n=1 Tax=viral metagenome TaxID=1070528 RepID=A0A6C0BLR9_9ZZZZ
MESFPVDLKSAVLEKAEADYQVRKQEWMSKQRQSIFENLVFDLSHGRKLPMVREFNRSHYAWELELMRELQNQKSIYVNLFIQYQTTRSLPLSRVHVENWDDVLKVHHVNAIQAEIDFISDDAQ